MNKTIKFILVITCGASLNCQAQKDLSNVLAKYNSTLDVLEYRDSSGNYYDRGDYGGLFLEVYFRKVEFDFCTKLVKVEGITSSGSNEKDTVGLCCVYYFLAVPINGYLTNIRNLGVSNSDSENQSGPEGFFRFETKLAQQDRLYFVSKGRSGLQEFKIGEALYKDK
jgi:hypothetical protein